jgi:hypothetical protein
MPIDWAPPQPRRPSTASSPCTTGHRHNCVVQTLLRAPASSGAATTTSTRHCLQCCVGPPRHRPPLCASPQVYPLLSVWVCACVGRRCSGGSRPSGMDQPQAAAVTASLLPPPSDDGGDDCGPPPSPLPPSNGGGCGDLA